MENNLLSVQEFERNYHRVFVAYKDGDYYYARAVQKDDIPGFYERAHAWFSPDVKFCSIAVLLNETIETHEDVLMIEHIVVEAVVMGSVVVTGKWRRQFSPPQAACLSLEQVQKNV